MAEKYFESGKAGAKEIDEKRENAICRVVINNSHDIWLYKISRIELMLHDMEAIEGCSAVVIEIINPRSKVLFKISVDDKMQLEEFKRIARTKDAEKLKELIQGVIVRWYEERRDICREHMSAGD